MSTFHAQLQQQALQLATLSGEPVRAFKTDFGGLVEINRQLAIILENGGIPGDGNEPSGPIAWADITGKPSNFTPSAHDHNDLYFSKDEVLSNLAAKQNSLDQLQLPIQHNNVAAGATVQGEVPFAFWAFVLSVSSLQNIWLRVYSSEAARTADAGRDITADPTPEVAPNLAFEVSLPFNSNTDVIVREQFISSVVEGTMYYSLKNQDATVQNLNINIVYSLFLSGMVF